MALVVRNSWVYHIYDTKTKGMPYEEHGDFCRKEEAEEVCKKLRKDRREQKVKQ